MVAPVASRPSRRDARRLTRPGPGPGLRPSVFHSEDGQPLSKFMERNAPVLGDQQLVDVVKALHAAGLVKAEVRAQ